jgi:hypothetical protein
MGPFHSMFLLEVRSSTKGVVCEEMLWSTLLEIHHLLIVGPWNSWLYLPQRP